MAFCHTVCVCVCVCWNEIERMVDHEAHPSDEVVQSGRLTQRQTCTAPLVHIVYRLLLATITAQRMLSRAVIRYTGAPDHWRCLMMSLGRLSVSSVLRYGGRLLSTSSTVRGLH